ncbi:folylpolyglutamate synthase/dihydrofolate synthase family protein [Gordonia sp. ABSL1-1]|uniref:bifunctional tetrahydrofolate synthase/dihydrofolate synthase n=1 Tax=Gordonia sp. ABSL1-1 TaxID=3053923 RepID=UPI00257456ED|nr:folylpolyglutamate synthase/dihydrofolate synthase family protein [Gordonia sp. ABSL1-1]MDL9938420.1 folylpolyglutamate synthase/dihydrofolate synthase family protein [Gordonia sp. ABSL1-1]
MSEDDGWAHEDPAVTGDPLGLDALLGDGGDGGDGPTAGDPEEHDREGYGQEFDSDGLDPDGDDQQPSGPAGPADSAEDLAELAEVEAELDTRWPETKIEPSLTRISTLMDLLGSPQHGYPAVHIAGTNGKTSVARMVDALFVALHRRTGRVTSPHLQRVTERISLDGKPISARRYVDTYRELEPYITMVDDSSTAVDGPRMSKFEVLTAMAYAAFAESPVDVAVIETGMGGRWDATNVIDGAVSVITPIAMDHADYLGDTLAAIAGEKAGIIKAGNPEALVPVDPVTIIAEQEPEVMEVLLRETVAAGTIVARAGSEFAVLESITAVGGQMLRLQGLGGVYDEVYLPLHGAHQADNAALALAAVEAFFGAGADRQLDIDAVRSGFASVSSPGRLERLRSAPTVFVDAAHNPHGANALAQALAEEFDFRRLVGVVGVLGDKDARGLLEALEPIFDVVVVTNNGSPRALDAETLADYAAEIFGEERVVVKPFLPDAVEAAVELAEENDGDRVSGAGVVITGSVVTAGAARTLFGKDPR